MLHDNLANQSNQKKILYIDDDPVNRSLINRLLTSYDFEVLEAQTGLEGITIARNEIPDLILMDVNMPGLDGHETTTRMRSLPTLETIPIVAVTARTHEGERELALAAGCDGYIPKPIDVDNFPDQVISYLDGYRETITPNQREHYLGQYSQKLVERLESKIVALEEANRRLQKTDKLKSDFITLTAHEFRTPITLVYGYARLLQSALKESDQADWVDGSSIADLAEKICQSVQRLNEAVNDILNISLLEADEMHLEYQPVNLANIINAALQELDPAKNGRALNITMQDLDILPLVMGDEERLQQVFWNILSNAIKFTPDGGAILVKGWVMNSLPSASEKDTASAAHFRNPEAGEGVIVLVRDTGIGIDPSEQKEIFEHFYIVGNTDYHTSSKTAFGGGGMGLGLPIACGIIKAHSGRIWVESAGRNVEKNLGSTFYILLPLKKAA